MKFLCERCKTKYSIADEKVRRKILKIRCKNCSNIITVRDPDSKPEQSVVGAKRASAAKPAAAAGSLAGALENVLSAQLEEAATVAGALPEFRPEAMEDDWYVGLNGQQRGPMPFAQLAELVERGTASEDAYVWRDGFDDWVRAEVVPELRPAFKKRKGSGAPGTKAAPRREVPRPTDGRLADRSGPIQAARSGPLSVGRSAPVVRAKAPEKKPQLSPLAKYSPDFDKAGEGDSLPDLSDELVEDPSRPGVPAAAAVYPAGGSVFRTPPPSADEPGSGQIDLAFTEPSRIVKLDALLAAGVGSGRGTGNVTGQVFQLPGMDAGDRSAEVAALAAGAAPTVRPLGAYSPVLQPIITHHEHRLYKLLAIGGGLATLMLVVVVLVLLPRGGIRTIIVEKEKSPEELGAEIAEQIAREEAAKRFGAASKVSQDVIPPARTPTRRGAPAPPPPKGKTVASRSDERLGQLYADSSARGVSPELHMPDRPADDPLAVGSPFRRGAKICLERALKKNPTLMHAKIEVKISINASGSASSVDIPMPYRTDFVGQCLQGVIRHLPWPSEGKPYDIEMPLVLSGS